VDLSRRRKRDRWPAVRTLRRVDLKIIRPTIDSEKHHAHERLSRSLYESLCHEPVLLSCLTGILNFETPTPAGAVVAYLRVSQTVK
jgi:hypothetical protein